MKTVDLYPFTVRLQDGREWAGFAEDVTQAAGYAWLRHHCGPANPAVLVIRADEPFVRRKAKRHWFLRLLIGEN